MTELSFNFPETTLDDEDSRARLALYELQATVDRFLARTGRSINDLSIKERQELVDKVDPHLAFELQESEDIYIGLPLVVGGPGGFLLTDSKGVVLGAQSTEHGDIVTGMVAAVHAYPVPDLRAILESAASSGDVPMDDQSLSAVVVLGGAKFYSSPTSDGGYEISRDLGDMQVVIPAIYGMETHVADISYLS